MRRGWNGGGWNSRSVLRGCSLALQKMGEGGKGVVVPGLTGVNYILGSAEKLDEGGRRK